MRCKAIDCSPLRRPFSMQPRALGAVGRKVCCHFVHRSQMPNSADAEYSKDQPYWCLNDGRHHDAQDGLPTLQPTLSRASKMAPASAAPAFTSVPLPSSSTSTSECCVASASTYLPPAGVWLA